MIDGLAGLLAILGYVPYVKRVLDGSVRPERASWLIWAVLTCIAFFSLMAEGARGSLWMPAMAGVGAIVVFALSIKYGMGGLAQRDTVALMMAAAGLAAWWFTKDAAYALLVTIAVDAIAAVLTAWKSFEHPDTEAYSTYLTWSASGLLSTISIRRLDTIVILYPLYVCLVGAGIAGAIFAGRTIGGSAASHRPGRDLDGPSPVDPGDRDQRATQTDATRLVGHSRANPAGAKGRGSGLEMR